MTHQTNEELRDQLDRKFNKYFEHYEDVEQSHIDKMVNEILSLIPQPEQVINGDFEDSCPHCKKAIYVLPRREDQIKVEIVENPIIGAKTILYKIVCVGNFNIDFLDKFYSKQEALDFCKRFNLKVVNEEKE